jgi:hypothetical protein
MPQPYTAAAARLSGVGKAILEAAAERFDVIATEAAARVVGNGGTMRIHGRGGRRSAVRMATRSEISGDALIVNGTPAGPWVWIQSGTRPHEIGKPGRGGPTFLKASAYAHPVRGPVMHHGSTGRRAWTRAVETFRDEYPELVAEEVRKAVQHG